MSETVLIRYGAIPEVARFRADLEETLQRDQRVVVQSPRGIEVGTVLECLENGRDNNGSNREQRDETDLTVLRQVTADDESRLDCLHSECEEEYERWCRRIEEWELNLELIDLEWMLDRDKLVLYVLNDRGPDCTKLALQAAAAGLGTVEVQPVDADGLVQLNASGGCGSGGCGSGGCGS